MDIQTISIVLVIGLLILLAIGMPLGMASAALALLVLIMKFEPTLISDPMSFGEGRLTGRPGTGALNLLAQKIFDLLSEYVLISVPLFIFMAALLERSGVAKAMYDSLDFWLSRTRGGIAIITSLMAVLLAAMSGIIGGEIVLLGLIALPQMLRLGYDQNLAIGTICASGSLGTMIPPSIVLIIYGLITETSIKALFTGAFIPGFMLASFIIIYIIIRTRMNPSLAPLAKPAADDPEGGEKFELFLSFLSLVVGVLATLLLIRAAIYTHLEMNINLGEDDSPYILGMPHHIQTLGIVIGVCAFLVLVVFGLSRTMRGWHRGKGLLPPVTIIGIVLGSIYGGVTGITEAAGMGAFAVFVIALLRGEASVVLVWDSLMRTLRSTGTIIWVTVGAAALSGAYTLAGGPAYIAQLIIGADMPTFAVLLTMMLILLFMGAFMDWVGIVLLIIPVFLPIVRAMPVEEIGFFGQLEPSQVAVWFGVLFCMNMQVSFLSPPFGGAAFYLKSVAPPHISLTDIFKGFLPFIGLQLLALSVLLIVPSIVTITFVDIYYFIVERFMWVIGLIF